MTKTKKRKREKSKDRFKMATASSASQEDIAIFKEEIVQVLQAHRAHIELGDLQGHYRKHFQKDINKARFGVSSVKQILTLLLWDTVDVFSVGKKQYVMLKSSPPPPKVQKLMGGAQANPDTTEGVSDNYLSEPSSPLSPQTWAVQDHTQGAPPPLRCNAVQMALKEELIQLIQSSAEGLISLQRLPAAYEQRYNRSLDLIKCGIGSDQILVDTFSDVLEIVSHCSKLSHKHICNKPTNFNPKAKQSSDKSTSELYDEMENLLRSYPNGLMLTSLNAKYKKKYGKTLPKRKVMYEKLKDDFEFTSVCKQKDHQFLRLKANPAKVSHSRPPPNSGQGLLGLCPIFSSTQNPFQHPEYPIGNAGAGSGSSAQCLNVASSPGWMALDTVADTTAVQTLDKPENASYNFGAAGRTVSDYQMNPHPRKQTHTKTEIYESEQPSVVSFGTVSDIDILPSLASRPLQEEPKTKKKDKKKEGKSKTGGFSESAKQDVKTPAFVKQEQKQQKKPTQQAQRQSLTEGKNSDKQAGKSGIKGSDEVLSATEDLKVLSVIMPHQPKEKQRQPLQVQQPGAQPSRVLQQQQQSQQSRIRNISLSQQDQSPRNVDAVAQMFIANIAEASELVTMDRVIDLLLQHFRVDSLRKLGVYRPDQLSALNKLSRLQSKVNAFIQSFIKVRAICTLHELKESLAKVDAPMDCKEKLDYAALQLGPLAKQPLVWQFFKFPQTKEDKDIPQITTFDVLEILRNYLTKKDLWRSKVKLENFVEYTMKEYDVDDSYELGLRIQSVGLGISAIKTATREQKVTMDGARERLKTSLVEEVTDTMEKIRKAVMSPADITGHQFTQLELRRRYLDMSAFQVVMRIFSNASELMDYSRHVRQFCTALRQAGNDPLSRSLIQLAISIGDLSRPVDLPRGLLESEDEEEEEEEEDNVQEEKSHVKSQPTEDQVQEELHRYLDRLQHGSLTLKDLARIETNLCQHFDFPDFALLSRDRATFLQFVSINHPEVLDSVGGALMGLVSSSPNQGSVYRPSRMDLGEFIRQCDPQKEGQEVTDTCLCRHYQVNSVEELGHGSVHRLSQQIIKMTRSGYQQEPNAVLYETALCASARASDTKQKDVGLFGSQSLESALGCLASAPLLEDLAEWSQWSTVFEPEHGNLKAFIERNPGQDVSPPIEINALEVRPGVLLRLATDKSPELFAAAAKRGDGVSTVGLLVSLVAKDGLRNVPLALLSNHLETALSGLAVEADQAGRQHGCMVGFVLDCLVAIPIQIGQAVVRQVILNPLTSVLGSEIKSRQLILKACQTTAQKTKIQQFGLLLGISEWKESFVRDRMPANLDNPGDDFSLDDGDDDDAFDFFNQEFLVKKPPKTQEVNVEEQKDTAPLDGNLLGPLAEPVPQQDEEPSLEQPAQSEEPSLEQPAQSEEPSLEQPALSKEPSLEQPVKEEQQQGTSEDNVEEILIEDEGMSTDEDQLPPEEIEIRDTTAQAIPVQPLAEDVPSGGDDIPPPDEPTVQLTPFQQSVVDCKAVVHSIQREEFGVGVVFDEEMQRLMDRQQERQGRSLTRLSEELYSKDTHFVLELIQNADDNDYEEEEEPALVFVVDRTEVVVFNNERGFSESNIRALSDIGKSTKGKHKRGYIGHKGIGFKSVFRVTDKPEIISNGYQVCFDRSTDQIGYILPTWVGPDKIDDIAEMDEPTKPWTTKITLPLKGDFQRTSSLVNKFEDIQPSLLLFLNRLRTIKVLNKEEKTTSFMSRRDLGGNVVEICHSKSTDKWLLIKKCLDATELQRLQIESTELGLAFPLSNGMSTEQNVFAYLPLRSYGFHFIIQGDFDIPSSREDVDADSAWNQWLRLEIAPLFIEALETFKTHFRDDTIKAVCQFLKFVPLESQILTDFFKKVAVEIHLRLKASPCMPVLVSSGDDDDVTWKRPSETIMCLDPLVREVVPSDTLWEHLNCSYLHQQVVGSVSEALLKSLGVKVLKTSELINIFSSVALAARQSGEPLTGTCVAQWLTCIYSTRKREYDISQDTLDRLRAIPMIPLSSGRVVALEEVSVFFPVNEEAAADQSQGWVRSASSKPLQALEDDMSTLDSRVLTSLDNVANSQIVQLLEDLGVRRISARDVIRHHILPVIQSDQRKDKSRDVMIGYAVYIKEQLQKQADVCDLEEIAGHLHILTNHGLVLPRQRPVHFTVTYGNKLDLTAALPGCDWVLLDSCYIYHQGYHRPTSGEMQQWQAFFMKLGVLNYLAVEKKVVTVKEDELDVTPWAELSAVWPKAVDGVYKIQDIMCREFEELIQADLETSTMLSQRQCLLQLLQREWQSNYEAHTVTVVLDQSGKMIAETQSSFAINLRTRSWLPCRFSWLPSTPVGGENNAVVYRKPGDVFVASAKTTALLSNHVPYLSVGTQESRSGMLQFMDVKTEGIINPGFMISKLKSWCSVNEESSDLTASSLFKTSLGHILRVYNYLLQNCIPHELTELFSDHRVVFVPKEGVPPSLEVPILGQFVHKSSVYWQDPSNLLQTYDGLLSRTRLESLYPPNMEDFFIRQINVDSMPTIKEYAQLLVHCAGDITLPNNDRIRKEIFVLYGMLGHKCVQPSTARGSGHWNHSAVSAVQQKVEIKNESAQFVKSILEEEAVFPTLGNKWVTMKDRPLVCDEQSRELQKLFLDKEVHLLNFGDRDRLGHVLKVEPVSPDMRVFLEEICGIEKLSDCINEEFITLLTKPSLQLQLFLHEICPYVQLFMVTHGSAKPEFQSTIRKLTDELRIAAKLKVMRFMTATSLEKLYRFKYDPQVFSEQAVNCGLSELTEFYIVSSIAQNLRQNSDVRREVAKLFSCGSSEIQGSLFNFLGSLLLELNSRKSSGNDGVNEGICKNLGLIFPLEGDDDPWEVPKPFIPEEVVKVKPVKVVPLPEQKPPPSSRSQLQDDGEEAAIHCWPPKSSAYGPQKSTKGGQSSGEDAILKKWPLPQAPDSNQPLPFAHLPEDLQPPPLQPRLQQPGDDAGAREGTTGDVRIPRSQRSQDGAPAVHRAFQMADGSSDGARASHLRASGQGANRDGITLPRLSHQLSDGVPSHLGSYQVEQGSHGYALDVSQEVVAEMHEEEEEGTSSSQEEMEASSAEECDEDHSRDGDEHLQEDAQSPDSISRQFNTPPQVQRSVGHHHPSSSSVRKYFVPPLTDGEAIEVEFEDLTLSPGLLRNLTDDDLPVALSENIDTTDIARWGEQLVYLYLTKQAPEGSAVSWINRENETGEPYDILITNGSVQTYVEVKSTVKDQKQVVEISPREVSFAQEKQQSFHLYRVFNAGSTEGVRLCRLCNLALRMDRKEIKLYMVL